MRAGKKLSSTGKWISLSAYKVSGGLGEIFPGPLLVFMVMAVAMALTGTRFCGSAAWLAMVAAAVAAVFYFDPVVAQ
jgi:chromate transport protein ChrA